ncbi:beta-N-acetylhexosaminidase [Actinospica robiniae]|uniref:beta-N-acetylhexosaminidase n=1 Tax=Actinospica robiniae TaxID=304901 RepID=UPI000557518C|nr:beta-N-acetylhexosaminidase [Actinospica robiniae]
MNRKQGSRVAVAAAFGLLAGSLLAGCSSSAAPARPAAPADAYAGILPAPVSAVRTPGKQFAIGSGTALYAASPAAEPVAAYLAGLLRPATGYTLPVVSAAPSGPAIELTLSGAPAVVGDEGYRLSVEPSGIVLSAQTAAGLFEGVQSLRQLLPGSIESRKAVQGASWAVPAGTVTDYPRYAYRGASLDVARHFFDVAEVEHYIDDVARYKIDYLHLHLTDDQGWRIAIDGYPALTGIGASTEVGGGTGGYYTQAQYKEIVAYAASRYITVIPEIDMPGHVNAAESAYGDLTCDGRATTPYTGIDTGFSTLCTGSQTVKTFVSTVLKQMVALTPGSYIDIGGDEARATSATDYAGFMTWAAAQVRADGKTPMGWDAITNAQTGSPAVAEYWGTSDSPTSAFKAAAASGTKVVLAPANHAYLDQKYDKDTVPGLDWAGPVPLAQSYEWDPATYLAGVPASAVYGVEAAMWGETLTSFADLEYLAFPRLPAVAELGWSPPAAHDLGAFEKRLAAQAPHWVAAGIGFYRTPGVDWPRG